MVILVCGGRNYGFQPNDAKILDEVLTEVVSWADDPGSLLIVNGGALGADQMATEWAKAHGIKFKEYPITEDEKQRHPGTAGCVRNQRMLDAAKPTQGVVFRGDTGTRDMMDRLYWARVNAWVVGG